MTAAPDAAPTARLVLAPCDPRTEARMRYAFGAYAALYGIRVVERGPADVRVAHGDIDGHVDGDIGGDRDIDGGGPADVVLPAGYRPRPASQPAPPPTWIGGMPSFHVAPSGQPDVLGEVFEWLAAPHERACTTPDDVGRVPPEHTLAGSHRIDRTVPWANRWLAVLHAAVRGALPRLPASPPSPFGPGRTFVASHDMDHLSADRVVNGRRVARNVGIALVQERSPRTGLRIAGAAARRIRAGRPVVNGIDDLLAGEAERGVRATYTVVADSTHRRDPGYRLDEPLVRESLRRIAEAGHEIAVHGSYHSLDRPGQLAREFALLGAAGHPATGCRQHWLRHRGDELFTALEEIGAQWDSTRGHPDAVGYRHGAAFPFLPYDLDRERPRPIVEIPLVIMERALGRVSDDPRRWPGIAVDVLRAAGGHGWGGTAVLWHDVAMPGTTLGPGYAEAYWAVLDAGDRWVTANEVAAATRARWAAAGASAGSPALR